MVLGHGLTYMAENYFLFNFTECACNLPWISIRYMEKKLKKTKRNETDDTLATTAHEHLIVMMRTLILVQNRTKVTLKVDGYSSVFLYHAKTPNVVCIVRQR